MKAACLDWIKDILWRIGEPNSEWCKAQCAALEITQQAIEALDTATIVGDGS
jgi:hypothetical protein